MDWGWVWRLKGAAAGMMERSTAYARLSVRLCTAYILPPILLPHLHASPSLPLQLRECREVLHECATGAGAGRQRL